MTHAEARRRSATTDRGATPMSASSLLATLWQRGVVLRLSDDGNRIVAPPNRLTPELRVLLIRERPEILRLLAYVDEYRALIRNAFAIMVDRLSAGAGLRELADDQARLTDELGTELAAAIRDNESRQWRRDTGLCPVCGDAQDCDACVQIDDA
jgi:TubC N-terminal docking domain